MNWFLSLGFVSGLYLTSFAWRYDEPLAYPAAFVILGLVVFIRKEVRHADKAHE